MAGYGAWGGQQQATSAWGAPQQQGWGQPQQQQQQMPQQQMQQQAAPMQQQQAWGMQQAVPVQAAPQATKEGFTVTGCTHGTVGGIVRGSFQLFGENHGKPTYKKDGQVNGLDVMSYFWDERDGAGFCGWWFGPIVGGDQVWAYHTDKSAAKPPTGGWKVPYDGPIDNTFVLTWKVAALPQQQQQQQQQQQWGQPAAAAAAAAAPAANAWGQQNQMQNQMAQMAQRQQEQAAAMNTQRGLDTQRAQLEDLKKKQALENSRRAEEMRQKQVLAQQQALEANKAKLAEANQQRLLQQKQKMEEMKMLQQNAMKARADEAAKKLAEQEAKKKEQVAVLDIRRVLQQFRASPPDKYDERKADLDAALAKNNELLGSQKERIMTEVETAVTQTLGRVTQVREAKAKEEEKKEAELNRRKELKAKADSLVAELGKLVEKAEQGAKSVAEEAEPFMSDGKEMKLAEIEACVSAVDEASKEATEHVKACNDFVLKEAPNIRNTQPIAGEAAPTNAMDMQKLVNRVNEAKKATQLALGKVNTAKSTLVKKAHAKEKYAATFAPLKKFGRDGRMTRKEIQAYAKGEFKLSLNNETLDNICSVLIKKDGKGIDKTGFHKLRTMIGVAREASIDAKKRSTREDREKLIAAHKEKLTDRIAKAVELNKEAIEAVSKVEKAVLPLHASKIGASAADMVVAADATVSEFEVSKKALEAAKETVTKLAEETEPELKAFLSAELKKLQAPLAAVEQRSVKATSTMTRFRADATKKNEAELETIRTSGIAMIFHHQGAKKLLKDGLYEKFDRKKKGKVEESVFVKFFATCELKDESDDRMSAEEASRLFEHFDTEGAGFLSKEAFMNLLRRFLKVMKASVLTEDTSTKSKPMRRLDEGEVLEALTGPTAAEGEEILRIKVKAMTDGIEGWVTPVGNRGTVFVEDGGDKFKVVKETILTGSFAFGGKDSAKDKKLKVGEILEVKEWAKKEETSGLMRMKVRVKSDGQLGYVTSVGNTGITFVEMM